jgi:hypothetical protein
MYNDIVYRTAVRVVSLHTSSTGIPDLYSAILRGSHHPLALAMEPNTGDVVGVSLELQDRVRICGFDVVELDRRVSGSSEKALVGGNTEAIYL